MTPSAGLGLPDGVTQTFIPEESELLVSTYNLVSIQLQQFHAVTKRYSSGSPGSTHTPYLSEKMNHWLFQNEPSWELTTKWPVGGNIWAWCGSLVLSSWTMLLCPRVASISAMMATPLNCPLCQFQVANDTGYLVSTGWVLLSMFQCLSHGGCFLVPLTCM